MMSQDTKNRITKDLAPDIPGRILTGAEFRAGMTDRFSIEGNDPNDDHWRSEEPQQDDFRSHRAGESVSGTISRFGGLTHMDRTAAQFLRPIQPACEATIPLARIDPPLITFYDFDPKATAPYHRLAISLISAAATRHFQRVLIASAHYGEGRTTLTLNLAAALARARQRVLVVDSDFVRPSSLRLLGLDAETGLAEAITQDLPAGQAMMRVIQGGFNLLPTRAQVENSAELLASPVFERLIRKLMPDYDFILFDSAPLLAVADASLLELHTEVTLLVIRAGCASTGQMARAIASLDEERLLGAVLNRVAT